MMKELLTECYRTTKKVAGVDPSKPGNLKQVLVDDNAFGVYVESLSEGLTKSDKSAFKVLAENSRVSLLENSMYAINPYETLTLPILRVFYPRLVAKEAVTVAPMDKPETIKAFIQATFQAANSGAKAAAPATGMDVSSGPQIGVPVNTGVSLTGTDAPIDILALLTLTKEDAHLERNFTITGVSSDAGLVVDSVDIVPAVEGHFSASVETTGALGGLDVISGQVDYLNGLLYISSSAGNVNFVSFTVTASLEENKINPKVDISVDKVRLYAKDRQISANWSIQMEQDMRALFDISMQAEIVNVLGQQIALDIDREIINSLSVGNARLNAANHTLSFKRNAPGTYTWGQKYWHENIIPQLNTLSAQIYTDTNMEAGNTILCNPLDAAILEDLQGFNYTGTSSADGDLGYRSATVAGGKWKVLTSAVVPKDEMICLYKPVEELKCVYLYCPYVPAVLHPYPLGANPSLTILSRYATNFIRPKGVAALTIDNT